MKQSGKCPKCGSSDIIVNAKAVDHGHGNTERNMTVAVFRNPEALLFKGKEYTNVSAWVCAECGFVEFYADTPSDIRIEDEK